MNNQNPTVGLMYFSPTGTTRRVCEEMEIDEEKMVNWLDFFNVDYDSEIKKDKKMFVRRHVSGHASKSELYELIEKMAPLKIIPIHTMEPNSFIEMIGQKVTLPNYAQPIYL